MGPMKALPLVNEGLVQTPGKDPDYRSGEFPVDVPRLDDWKSKYKLKDQGDERHWQTQSSLNITEVIKQGIQEFGGDPVVINGGQCEDFAWYVHNKIPEALMLDSGFDDNFYGHCFVEYEGKYYDVENPEGVEDWHDLNYFKRKGLSSTPMRMWKTKGNVVVAMREE